LKEKTVLFMALLILIVTAPLLSIAGAGTIWANEIVDSGGDVGWSSSLALDSAGNPHISYYDNTNDYLKYAHGVVVSPTGSIVINGGAASTSSTGVTLTLSYSATAATVAEIRLSNDGVWDTEAWETPATSKAWTLTSGDGSKTKPISCTYAFPHSNPGTFAFSGAHCFNFSVSASRRTAHNDVSCFRNRHRRCRRHSCSGNISKKKKVATSFFLFMLMVGALRERLGGLGGAPLGWIQPHRVSRSAYQS
jgi:hypothetical protein